MSTEVERIRDQLRRAVHGEAWHGPAVLEAMAAFDEEGARERVPPYAHNAVELVLHIASWLEIARARIEGRVVTPDVEMDWPDPGDPGPAAWSGARQRLLAAYGALDDGLAALADTDLERGAAGKDYSIYFLAHGVIQHSLYHAGQIVLLARLLERGS